MNRQTLYSMIIGGAVLLVGSMLFRNNGRMRVMKGFRRYLNTSRSFLNGMGKQMMRRLQMAR